MNLYAKLYLSFAKVGALTFGGGYAMLPMLQREIVEKRGWATQEQIMDYYAVSQCLPGFIAINFALLAGHKVKGRPGGICAALGMVTPSILIILAVAAFLRSVMEYPIVQQAFFGIRVVVCALILEAMVKLWKPAVKDKFTLGVYLAVLGLALWTPLPKILLILLAVAAGIGVGLRHTEGTP